MPLGSIASAAASAFGGAFGGSGAAAGAASAGGATGFGTWLGNAGAGLVKNVGSNLLSNKLTSVGGKFLGIPTAGQQLAKDLDDAFPGTNPWERLGAAGPSAAQISGQRSQVRIARIQADATKYAADRGKEASLYSSGLPLGKGGVSAAGNILTGKPVENYDTQIAINRQMAEAQFQRLDQQTKLLFEQTAAQILDNKMVAAKVPLRHLFASAQLEQISHGALGQAIRAWAAAALGDDTLAPNDRSWQETAVAWALAILSIGPVGRIMKGVGRGMPKLGKKNGLKQGESLDKSTGEITTSPAARGRARGGAMSRRGALTRDEIERIQRELYGGKK